MPQASNMHRALMEKWFGDPIDDGPPSLFLISRGYTETRGYWRKPTPAHTVSHEEACCLDFLMDEWDHAFLWDAPTE